VAALLKEELGIEARIEKGGIGELSVWADGERIAGGKVIGGLIKARALVEAVRSRMSR